MMHGERGEPIIRNAKKPPLPMHQKKHENGGLESTERKKAPVPMHLRDARGRGLFYVRARARAMTNNSGDVTQTGPRMPTKGLYLQDGNMD
jgi:hypothetical protein